MAIVRRVLMAGRLKWLRFGLIMSKANSIFIAAFLRLNRDRWRVIWYFQLLRVLSAGLFTRAQRLRFSCALYAIRFSLERNFLRRIRLTKAAAFLVGRSLVVDNYWLRHIFVLWPCWVLVLAEFGHRVAYFVLLIIFRLCCRVWVLPAQGRIFDVVVVLLGRRLLVIFTFFIYAIV